MLMQKGLCEAPRGYIHTYAHVCLFSTQWGVSESPYTEGALQRAQDFGL